MTRLALVRRRQPQVDNAEQPNPRDSACCRYTQTFVRVLHSFGHAGFITGILAGSCIQGRGQLLKDSTLQWVGWSITALTTFTALGVHYYTEKQERIQRRIQRGW